MKKYMLFVVLWAAFAGGCASSSHLYLTWQGDPATTMTVNYHTLAEAESAVYFDSVSHGGELSAYATKVEGVARQIPGMPDQRWIHSVELTGLTPGATYYFAVPEGDATQVRERKFRTLPNDGSPIRFVDGGDMGILPAARRLNARAAAQSPLFVEIGGDIAYENGDVSRTKLYDIWLKNWEDTMVTPEGYTIPGMFAMGNHETNDASEIPESRAPFYFGYFVQGGSSNFVRELGPNGVLIFLDSGHTQSWESQGPWLRETLERYQDRPFKIATYHVPLYPSHRDYEGSDSKNGRKYWLPLFDEFELTLGLEHHDHTFKRSKPLRNNMVAEEGTLYLGDGCMGMPARTVNRSMWYLEKTETKRHFWLIELSSEHLQAEAIDLNGDIFDTVTIPR